MEEKIKKEEKLAKITGKTKLGDIVEKYPKAAEVLADKYQLHCIGCFAAAFETLKEGAEAHGMSEKEIEKLVEDLNKLIDKN